MKKFEISPSLKDAMDSHRANLTIAVALAAVNLGLIVATGYVTEKFAKPEQSSTEDSS